MIKFALLAAAILLPVACASTLDPAAAVSPTYGSISSVILVPVCSGCHGGSGGYFFDTYAHTLQAVTPGTPGTSPLYMAVSSQRMPRGLTKLSGTQVQAISDWIAAGAPNN
jgi:mono/diheme cytochrome c family protein